MRIVHYIPQLIDNDLLSNYLRTVTKALEEKVSVSIITYDNRKDMLTQACPDIIHIHSCWDYTTARLAKQMAKRGAAVILSPHGALDTYSYRHEQPIMKHLRSLLYLRSTTKNTDAVIVTTEQEEQEVLRLNWQKRIGVIKNALLDSTTTAAMMADDLIRFYQKVIDSRYYTLMSSKEKEGICSLLREGVTDDTFSDPISHSQRDLLSSISDTQWRRMLLYADDEDIRRHIDKAILRLQLTTPAINTEAIDRFMTRHPKAKGLLAGTNNDARLQRETTAEERSLRVICSMLLSAHHHVESGTLSMNHLADLYTHLKYEDYDEDRLKELTKELGIYRFAQSIVQLLIEDMQLEEGFQPLKPRNGRDTRKLRTLLIH